MHFVRVSLLTISSLGSVAGIAEFISTAQIIERTLTATPSCLNWRLVGSCQWLHCDLLGCSVQSSPKVRHYIPDLLVNIHRAPDDIPWLEMQQVFRVPQSFALRASAVAAHANPVAGSGGDAANSTRAPGNGDVRFYEATVFGHPLADLLFESENLLCEAVTKGGKPYFQSALDALAWRFSPIESVLPDALLPGRREIGSGANSTWGSVYPRNGFVTQQDPAKAAAVVAQRACDIVISSRRHRVALALDEAASHTWVPTMLEERNPATGLWQMIFPTTDGSCQLFGSNDPAWSVGRINDLRSFIWNLWRPYECCEPRGEKYLGSIDF